ncbi:MAG: proteasome assembly chaperone family protein [Desulfurococcales archaeon]|nr:proteasome assembly chaperone family protein [Desulfurococcales archaeon]
MWEMKPVEILIYPEYKEVVNRRKWTLITGFPGFGYVGTIATRYIADKLSAVKVGDVITKYMPDFAALEDYGVMTPYELFVVEDEDLMILINNSIPQPPERVAYALRFAEWFSKIGGKAILAGGLNKKFKVSEEDFRWACIHGCGWFFEGPQIEKGLYIVGPLAMFFTAFNLRKIPTLLLFPYTDPSKYDPGAAAVFVREVSKLLGLRISVDDLIQYSKIVAEAEATLEEALKKSREDKGVKPYM